MSIPQLKTCYALPDTLNNLLFWFLKQLDKIIIANDPAYTPILQKHNSFVIDEEDIPPAPHEPKIKLKKLILIIFMFPPA